MLLGFVSSFFRKDPSGSMNSPTPRVNISSIFSLLLLSFIITNLSYHIKAYLSVLDIGVLCYPKTMKVISKNRFFSKNTLILAISLVILFAGSILFWVGTIQIP